MSAPGKNVQNAHVRAIVLAAGEGRRMGGSKALLVVDARPLVVRHVQRLAELGCESIAVVVRPDVARTVSRLLEKAAVSRLFAGGLDVRVIAAETSSQAASLAAGLATWRSLASAASRSRETRETLDMLDTRDTILVVPVDMRPASLGTMRALAGRLASDREALAVTPSCRGRGGHPIAVRAEVLAPYSASASGAEPPPLRDVLAAAGARRVRIDVDDPNVLDDLDEPADLEDVDTPLRFADAAYAS
jgi:CTP:molybdopterin cytidylyltransferase MocA